MLLSPEMDDGGRAYEYPEVRSGELDALLGHERRPGGCGPGSRDRDSDRQDAPAERRRSVADIRRLQNLRRKLLGSSELRATAEPSRRTALPERYKTVGCWRSA